MNPWTRTGVSSDIELATKMSILAPDEFSNPLIVLPWCPIRYPTFLVLTCRSFTSWHASGKHKQRMFTRFFLQLWMVKCYHELRNWGCRDRSNQFGMLGCNTKRRNWEFSCALSARQKQNYQMGRLGDSLVGGGIGGSGGRTLDMSRPSMYLKPGDVTEIKDNIVRFVTNLRP